jgi:hypothetical protein
LEISVDLWNLGFELILVACNNKLLSVIMVIIWAIDNEAKFRDLSSISFSPLKVINGPSI